MISNNDRPLLLVFYSSQRSRKNIAQYSIFLGMHSILIVSLVFLIYHVCGCNHVNEDWSHHLLSIDFAFKYRRYFLNFNNWSFTGIENANQFYLLLEIIYNHLISKGFSISCRKKKINKLRHFKTLQWPTV